MQKKLLRYFAEDAGGSPNFSNICGTQQVEAVECEDGGSQGAIKMEDYSYPVSYGLARRWAARYEIPSP